MKKPLIMLCVSIVICSLLTVSLFLKLPSAPSDDEPQTFLRPNDEALQRAISHGIAYLRQIKEPMGLLMLNVMYRQFGIAEFNDSLQRFDQQLASNSDPISRIFRRIADYNNVVQPKDFLSVTDQLDRLTIPALYADRITLPDDYLSQLTDSVNGGSNLLTHALLATIWLQDNNCSLQLPKDFKNTLYQDNALLIGDSSRIDDIELEAAAFLYQAGQGNLVNPVFVQNIIAAQYIDGGWSTTQDTPNNTNWHPSILALMILLYVEHPVATYPPMLAPALS
jgi:hypothetical protein